MAQFLNIQNIRWNHNKDPVLKLRQQEQEASALLAFHGKQVDASNMFVVLMSTPYVAGFPEHGRHVSKNEEVLALTFHSASEPSLPYRLSKVAKECSCADLSVLKAEKIHLSGSVREGTHVRVWSEIGSDIDAMFQLGPARVLDATTARHEPPLRSGSSSTGVDLRVEHTPNLGYVLLKHTRREGCRHAGGLTFGADRAVSLLDVFRARLDAEGTSRREGPALNTHVADFQQHWQNTDLVPCLTVAGFWPGSEFISRACRSGQPALGLARKLSKLPVFLVPVGFPGSPTERDEWRVSFSRHEYILLRDMSEEQLACLTLLKTCKAILDLHGLKSYHLKTALMWLSETRPRAQWTRKGTKESALLIITYLEDAMQQKRLPCYFWPEINILATRNSAQLSEISSDLRRLKDHLLSCSLALVTNWLCSKVPVIAERLLFSDIPVPFTDSMTVKLLTDNFMENLLRGQADIWGYIHGLITSAVSPGALPMPFGACFSLYFRSVKQTDGGAGGSNWLPVLLELLKTMQRSENASTTDGEDSWMVEH